ncbi:putative autophagy protein Apg9 [Aspergillus bombycis]|uniref:Putative autophagy protein Apg9 n=1 Tax=Aspergillus bombycis TaxID=109264 RepID=A0A1F7ZIA4_9EURO|nr:putative autophagy protein Apg9 [Aspergillus bombycis]OGM39181.1 putative autophagy protein Apg9 [Aspergillus bombycis]
MMTSNILSRFLPPNGSPSVYETLRRQDAESNPSDVEERAGLEFEDDRRTQFSDRELEEAMVHAARDGIQSPSPSPSEPFLTQRSPQRTSGTATAKSGSRRRKHSRPRWMHQDPDDGDDDVPPSLLVEGHQDDDEMKSRLPPLLLLITTRSENILLPLVLHRVQIRLVGTQQGNSCRSTMIAGGNVPGQSGRWDIPTWPQ